MMMMMMMTIMMIIIIPIIIINSLLLYLPQGTTKYSITSSIYVFRLESVAHSLQPHQANSDTMEMESFNFLVSRLQTERQRSS